MNNIIDLTNITKSYFEPEETKVLIDIDLSIARSGITSIVGQSGSGKSTLMNILGTLDQPTKGKLMINGIDISTLSSNELAKLRNETIGFVFQFHYLLPEFSVLENVLIPYRLTNRKVGRKEISRAKDLLNLVGLSDKLDNLSTKISGGQQQRTAIARALMNNPEIILADEPTGNLDSDTSTKIFDLFYQINKDLKTTFVIVTHDDRIAQKADSIVEIKDGRILSNKSIKK